MSFEALTDGVQTGQWVGRKGEWRDRGRAGQGVMLTPVCVCARARVCARTQAPVMCCDIHAQALVMHYDVHTHTASCDAL